MFILPMNMHNYDSNKKHDYYHYLTKAGLINKQAYTAVMIVKLHVTDYNVFKTAVHTRAPYDEYQSRKTDMHVQDNNK